MTDITIQAVWSGVGMVALGAIIREFPYIGEASIYLIVVGIILLAIGILGIIGCRAEWA